MPEEEEASKKNGTISRLFKEKIGLTVMDYILKTRVTMAKELLCKTDLSVTEISESCGFSSISFFSRTFKNETGVSPLKYKKCTQAIQWGE